ncbi:MAG: pyrroline-5-carboxylate reductase [Acidimicrobiales bacterium]
MPYRLAIVGVGRLGGALAEGLLDAAWCEPGELVLVQHTRETRDELVERFPGVAVVAELGPADVDANTGAVLCVKPDHAESVARVLGALGVTRLLSVVAGLSSARLEAAAGPIAVVRAMPNTPVLVRRGVSAIAGGAHATSADLEWAESVLGAVGSVVRVSERHLDAVTGLSGAMPAYVFMVVEALIEAGVHQGLSRSVARDLVVGTLAGSAQLLETTGASPEELRAQVTSPGGVTAAGLRVLEGRALRAALLDAVAAASERARQLGR